MISDEEYNELMQLFYSPDNTPKRSDHGDKSYKLYVAYGSNINVDQMKFRCPDAQIYSTGMVQDYELSFNKVATLIKKEGELSPALVWKLPSSDEKSLDKFEGYPHKYKKIAVDVKCGDEIISGMAYVMVNSNEYKIPTDEYYQRIEKGYIENGLPLEYLENALAKTEEKVYETIEYDDDPLSLYNRQYLDYVSNNDDAMVNAFRIGAMYQQKYADSSLQAFEIIDLLNEYKTADQFEKVLNDIDMRESVNNLYCAYGSNMNIEQMKYRCPNSKIISTGTLEGYELIFNRYANVIKSKNESTPVVLWEIAPQDWKKLDQYEGYPSLYRKEIVAVTANGKTQNSLIYIMNSPDFAMSPPCKPYLDGIIQGCLQNDIDISHLDKAYCQSVAAVRKSRNPGYSKNR